MKTRTSFEHVAYRSAPLTKDNIEMMATTVIRDILIEHEDGAKDVFCKVSILNFGEGTRDHWVFDSQLTALGMLDMVREIEEIAEGILIDAPDAEIVLESSTLAEND